MRPGESPLVDSQAAGWAFYGDVASDDPMAGGKEFPGRMS